MIFSSLQDGSPVCLAVDQQLGYLTVNCLLIESVILKTNPQRIAQPTWFRVGKKREEQHCLFTSLVMAHQGMQHCQKHGVN